MLKPLGSFNFAFSNLSSAAAIGSAGTGASFTAPSPSGRPCCHDGGGAPGCAAAGAGWLAGDGLTTGCCAKSGPAATTRPAASAASSNTVREHDRIVFIAHSSPAGVVGDAARSVEPDVRASEY